jgi:hypothetical protein
MSLSAQARTEHTDVIRFQSEPAGETTGEASLKRSDQGVLLSLRTDQATPGHAYTIWFIIFNNPEYCDLDLISGCAGSDLGTPEVVGSGVNGGGGVADADGNFTLTSFLPVGFIHTNPVGDARQLFGPGLQDAMGAEVHIVVRSHGESVDSVAQISHVNGDCNPECSDPFAAIFVPKSKKQR